MRWLCAQRLSLLIILAYSVISDGDINNLLTYTKGLKVLAQLQKRFEFQCKITKKVCFQVPLIGLATLLMLLSASTSAEEETKPSKNKGDRPGHDMTDPIPAEQIPPAPVLSVPEAIDSIVLQNGFVIENVASEPLVQSPIDIAFDADGRMWVVEMQTYMPDLDANNEEVPEGRIVLVEDTDADGKADKRTVFLNDIVLPRTVTTVKGGILYASHEHLHFAEVLSDNSVGIHEIVDKDYAKGGNVEHKPNAMQYSLDNWYYNAKSNRKYKVIQLSADLPSASEEVYRNKYWKMVVANTDNRGQWGISVDDYGRLYHNGNSSAAQGEFLRPGVLMKNPGLKFAVKANTLGSNRVYPIRINPGVNRAYLPNTLVAEGPNKGKLNKYTAAAGNNLYRGDQFPDNFYGASFTPEPAGNLISVRTVTEGIGQLEGKEIYSEAEILASTDERFRPVNLNTAPDGSLYIVDMYHGVIQHADYLTTYLRKQYESRELQKHNPGMGRIYRLRWADKPLGIMPSMSSQSPKMWVRHLAHSNGWWRDMARQLIVQDDQQALVPAIKKLFFSSDNHVVRINALWTLDGLNALDANIIEAALADNHNKVIVAGIELSTRLSAVHHQKIATDFMRLQERGYELAINIATVTSQINSPLSLEVLKQILVNYSDKPFIAEAAISGLAGKEKAFSDFVANSESFNNQPFLDLLAKVGQKDIANSNMLNLEPWEQDMYKRGKSLYDGSAACFGCHGKDGEGIDSMGPPLAGSEWVVGSTDVLSKVLLHGLMGPITVNNINYDTSMVMPGFAQSLSDNELADISTYIRNNWSNKASAIYGDAYTNTRKQTAARQLPYTAKELDMLSTEGKKNKEANEQ